MSGAGTESVRDVPGKRFEIETDAGTARLEYRREDGTVRLNHTEVPLEAEGQGLGSRLARHALAWAREEGLEVVPICPFVASFIQRHPEHLDIVDDDWSGKARLAAEDG